MKRMMFATLILLAVMALAVPLSAQPGPGRCGGGCDGHGSKHGPRFDGGPGDQLDHPGMMGLLRHADELGLTEEQQSKLEKMQAEFAKERIDLQAELEKAQIDLRQLMKADEPDEMAVSSAIDRTTKLKGDLAKMRFRHIQKVKSILTKDQLTKLRELPKKMHQRRHDGKSQGKGMGMGMGQNQNGDQNLPRPRRDRSSW